MGEQPSQRAPHLNGRLSLRQPPNIEKKQKLKKKIESFKGRPVFLFLPPPREMSSSFLKSLQTAPSAEVGRLFSRGISLVSGPYNCRVVITVYGQMPLTFEDSHDGCFVRRRPRLLVRYGHGKSKSVFVLVFVFLFSSCFICFRRFSFLTEF